MRVIGTDDPVYTELITDCTTNYEISTGQFINRF